jgi:hypothetical protein
MAARSPPGAVFGADENAFDTGTFIRLSAWCGAALGAVVIAITVGRSDLGAQRAHAALVALVSPPVSNDAHLSDQMGALASGLDRQLNRQNEAIRAIGDARNASDGKVDALERAVSDLTGTLTRATERLDMDVKAAQQTAAAAVIAAKVAQARAETPDPVSIGTPAALPPPRIQARDAPRDNQPLRQTTRDTQRDAQRDIDAPPAVGPPAQIHPAVPPYTGTVSLPNDTNGPPGMMRPFPVQPPSAEPPVALPRPKPAAAKGATDHTGAPLHAPLLRSNPLMTTGIFDAPAAPSALTVEFAVDLGAGTTVDAMRSRWSEIKKSQSPLFDSLKPLVSLKDDGKAGQELHLIAGPLTNAAASERFCAVLSGSGIPCQATVYEGQHLAAR